MEKHIIIDPELAIGTPFYFMKNNVIEKGYIAEYQVLVTSRIDINDGWLSTLLDMIRRKDIRYKLNFTYVIKLENSLACEPIWKNKVGNWYFKYGSTNRIYFNQQELMKDILN